VNTTKTLYADLLNEAVKRNATLIEFSILPYFSGTRSREGIRWAETLITGFSAYFFSKMSAKHKITLILKKIEIIIEILL